VHIPRKKEGVPNLAEVAKQCFINHPGSQKGKREQAVRGTFSIIPLVNDNASGSKASYLKHKGKGIEEL